MANDMANRDTEFGREVRGIIFKSGLTGVAATVAAVAAFSPAGFGGMIGTSVASGFGAEGAGAVAEDPYANLPPFPAPLTADEVSDIRGQLAATAASLAITRAATEDKIAHMRALTVAPAAVHAPMAVHAPVIVAAAPRAETTVLANDGGDAAYRERHQELASLLLDDSL